MIRKYIKRNNFVRELIRHYRATVRIPKWDKLLNTSSDQIFKFNNINKYNKNILIATSTGGNLPATTLESLIAVSLAVRGAYVSVLLCDAILPACFECDIDWYREEGKFSKNGPTKSHCKDCFNLTLGMYKKIGIPVLVYSDFLKANDRSEIEHIVSSTPVADIGNYQLDGINVGEHAMAGALRFYARATLDDVYSDNVLRRYFRAALITKYVMDNVFDNQVFDTVVCHHGIYVPQGVIGSVARYKNIKVVNWHVAYRKNSFIFSHNDTYHHTMMSEPIDNWIKIKWSSLLNNKIINYLNSRWWGTNDWIYFNKKPNINVNSIEKEVGIDFKKTSIGMLTNVMWDAQLHYPANAFKNMLEWVIATIKYFATRPDLQLLIRVHPAEVTGTLPSRQPIVKEIYKLFNVLPKNVFIIPSESKLCTYTAMQKCNAVIIYGTKTGVELVSMGIPTIVAGEAWIRNKGLTMDAHSIEEYYLLLDMLPLEGVPNEDITIKARKYAYHYFYRRMIPLKCVEPTKYSPPYKISLNSIRDLEPKHDMGLDIICDGILTGSDFIYHDEIT